MFNLNGNIIMQKKALALLFSVLTVSAYANEATPNQLPVDPAPVKKESIHNIEAQGSVGLMRMKKTSYEDVSYNVGIKDTIKVQDNHHFYMGLFGSRGNREGNPIQNVKSYDMTMGYKHETPINYSLSVAPYAGVGYESTKLKNFGNEYLEKNRKYLNRGYAEIGLEGKYNLNQQLSLRPNVSYERDLNVKEKVNKAYLDDPKRGYKYNAELGVGYQLPNNSEIVVAPYYSIYKNKNLSEDAQKFRQDSGLRVKYDF